MAEDKNELIVIVGCGGGGAWIAQCLSRMPDVRGTLCLVDGDTVEERNLDRQLFDSSKVGLNKAEALMRTLYRASFNWVTVLPEYVSSEQNTGLRGLIDLANPVTLFLCVDNHPARMNVLSLADEFNADVVNAANETTDCEGWFYRPSIMKDTALDPRVRFPELLTDKEGDPLSPCTSQEEREENPQTALANMGSAFMALHLWRCWRDHKDLDLPNRSVQHTANFARCRTASIKEVYDNE